MSVLFVRVVCSALLLGRFPKPNFVSLCMGWRSSLARYARIGIFAVIFSLKVIIYRQQPTTMFDNFCWKTTADCLFVSVIFSGNQLDVGK